MSERAPQAEYEQRREQALAEDKRLDGQSAVWGNGRVVVVAIALVVMIRAWTAGHPQPWSTLGVLAALVVVSLVIQGGIDRRRRRAQLRAALYAKGLARLAGEWIHFPSRGERFVDPQHPYARDLDVVGNGSLFQLLDTTRTKQGEGTLGGWLLAPSSIAQLDERRATVQALTPALDAREALALAGADEELTRIDEAPLVAWGEGPALLVVPTALKIAGFLLPPITITLLVLWRLQVLSVWPALPFLAAHFALLRYVAPSVAHLAQFAEHTERMLTQLLPLLAAAEAQPSSTPQITRLRERLLGAIGTIGSLRRRVTVFQSRGNLIVAVISPFVLWDFHAGLLLQGWQRRHGGQLRGWFDALGELEALSSLATYAYEHSDDVWPELVDGPLAYEADALGHPLLPADRCVRNDVHLQGPGTLLLVTGSNMSGKSTLLRAVGLGAVLAQTGLPVRAKRLRLSHQQVATAMRVSDSLQEGASFFYAEVLRLKRVVDLAHEGTPVLFLLDEILQGTNTRERSLGARSVVVHLARAGAMGLVSTHDLSLVQLAEALPGKVSFAHFTDHVEEGRMVFDYRMRDGVVQSTNALRVMQAAGLEVELPQEQEGEQATVARPR